jgi:hypothetical protein
MTILATDFIAAFPEFNTPSYPIAQINFWIPQAYNQLNACRFGVTLDLAAMLFVAHNLVLSARDAAITANGGIPGQSSGPLNSKGVDKVHAGYDTTANQSPGAGMWNATSYGQRLYRMMISNGGFVYFPGGRPIDNWNRRWPTPNWQFVP